MNVASFGGLESSFTWEASVSCYHGLLIKQKLHIAWYDKVNTVNVFPTIFSVL